MHIATPSSVTTRIAVAVTGALGVMLATLLITRPEMAAMPMAMVQRLIVGFGL